MVKKLRDTGLFEFNGGTKFFYIRGEESVWKEYAKFAFHGNEELALLSFFLLTRCRETDRDFSKEDMSAA